MSKGYVIFAQNNSEHDYTKLAYVNALSIKITQTKVNSVSLITDSESIPEIYSSVFDSVIQFPFKDDAANSQWKIENRRKIFHLSPYREMVILDADMIFLSDVSNWWDYFSKRNMFIVDKVKTYRNENINDSFYRRTFVRNNLPNAYSAFCYFKKNETSFRFWNLVNDICENWQEYYINFLKDDVPQNLSIDVAFAIAIKIIGNYEEFFSDHDFLTFTHMKGMIQNWENPHANWIDAVSPYFESNGNLKIGNYQQQGIFHYTEKEIITNEIVKLYEDLYQSGKK
jgi:hypothetical protein